MMDKKPTHYPAGEFSAVLWAEEFVRVAKNNPGIAHDLGTMMSWFATAIMTGYDVARNNPANRFGVRVKDGGVPGMIVRCGECGGSGELHHPDEMPELSTPTEGPDDA